MMPYRHRESEHGVDHPPENRPLYCGSGLRRADLAHSPCRTRARPPTLSSTKALLIQLPKPSPRASITTSPRSKPIGICCGAWSSAVGSSIISCADFLTHHPDAQVLSLGSGLSTQFERLDNGRLHWIDVDLPKVANLRRTLFPPHPRKRLVSASVSEAGWTSILGDLRGPTFVVAEGLLMYLERAQVFQLARRPRRGANGGPAEFAYDYYCAQMVGQAWLNPSLRRLGAEFKWGMAGPEELSLGEPRWRVIDTYPVMERLGWPYDILWPSFRFFTGVRPYGIAHFRLLDGARAHARRGLKEALAIETGRQQSE